MIFHRKHRYFVIISTFLADSLRYILLVLIFKQIFLSSQYTERAELILLVYMSLSIAFLITSIVLKGLLKQDTNSRLVEDVYVRADEGILV